MTKTYRNPRAIIREEYGSSTNLLTPDVVRVVGRHTGSDRWAAEISIGEGMERGTWLAGVSVVTVDADGNTDRDIERSTAFLSENREDAIADAVDYAEALFR